MICLSDLPFTAKVIRCVHCPEMPFDSSPIAASSATGSMYLPSPIFARRSDTSFAIRGMALFTRSCLVASLRLATVSAAVVVLFSLALPLVLENFAGLEDSIMLSNSPTASSAT